MGVLVQLMSAFHVKDFLNALKLLIDVIKIIKKKRWNIFKSLHKLLLGALNEM